jgi:uncharacterized repeat protein (TIGR03803 family)
MNATRGALILAVLCALVLIAARPAQAQTETVLYNFTGSPDGAWPESRLTSDGADNLYGTTVVGGLWGGGTVFELSPNGDGGWNENVLYSFTGGADGSNPTYSYVIFDSAGNLYGTAANGGANGYGVVFELSPAGAGWKETALYSFANDGDGANPANGLIMDPAGNLYGTTQAGGVGNYGTVFELSPSGGGWTEQVIDTYAEGYAGLSMDAAGNLFGVTYCCVFELSPNGNGGWNKTFIHTFAGPPKDGSGPESAPVPDQAGNLYGTTWDGGHKNRGTVYRLSNPKKRKKWSYKILWSFRGGADGGFPWAGIVLDTAGNLYGTTTYFGKAGSGTVFELVGGYTEKTLSDLDGIDPFGSLILDNAGDLYGTTYYGGLKGGCGGPGCGDVFEVIP